MNKMSRKSLVPENTFTKTLVADRVGVQGKAFRRMSDIPLPQSYVLKDVDSMRGGKIRSLLGRDAFSFFAKHGNLTF